MACITMVAPLAMATTELARVIHYEDASIGQFESNVEQDSLRMSWVVVTDGTGKRRLRMRWILADGGTMSRDEVAQPVTLL